MKYPIQSADALGQIIKATRKSQRLRQDDAAGASGVSESFLGKVESGNTSVTWGMLFQVLSDLGIELSADITESAAKQLTINNRAKQNNNE